jgi:hypothetical protein
MAPEKWFQLRYKSVRLVKVESEGGMAPRSSLKCRKTPVSAESSAKASGMKPVNDRPCNEMLATLPSESQTTTNNHHKKCHSRTLTLHKSLQQIWQDK